MSSDQEKKTIKLKFIIEKAIAQSCRIGATPDQQASIAMNIIANWLDTFRPNTKTIIENGSDADHEDALLNYLAHHYLARLLRGKSD